MPVGACCCCCGAAAATTGCQQSDTGTQPWANLRQQGRRRAATALHCCWLVLGRRPLMAAAVPGVVRSSGWLTTPASLYSLQVSVVRSTCRSPAEDDDFGPVTICKVTRCAQRPRARPRALFAVHSGRGIVIRAEAPQPGPIQPRPPRQDRPHLFHTQPREKRAWSTLLQCGAGGWCCWQQLWRSRPGAAAATLLLQPAPPLTAGRCACSATPSAWSW